MESTLKIMDNRTTIEIDKDIPSYISINFNLGTSLTELMLSPANFEDLGNKMFPDGIMPEDFNKKVDMLNLLLEELSPVRDKENPDWRISKAEYNTTVDEIYYESEEV
jgi:hypothetical protein